MTAHIPEKFREYWNAFSSADHADCPIDFLDKAEEAGAARSAPTPTLSAPQSILAVAREQVEQELGPRPSITSVGSWTGYRTNSDEQECAAFVSHLSTLAAMRRWDRAVSDRCKLLGMAPTLIGDA